ncbi:MAG: hypothetical protein A2V58_01685 [Candidatus Muproteobacteria bacterium RBG_19FT_COMBO_61_10]|uniref:Uncharacterized protein n=1 Tax=Candidatus Muproteobacteria bacterium RBG_19FT_COMBO_61_10 TaxID=1817761 RepID=A0A1F6UNN1_9PROT|nr:MAG: hypothetical protein A2V58_01685 [Candidatus Muproteobacteria bacterium RBG_19FT_COMBO_61_10]
MWVTEINLREGYDEPLSGRAQRIGEVIIDPTGEPTQAPFLSIHTPGILIDRDPDSEKIRLIPLHDDRACSPLVR